MNKELEEAIERLSKDKNKPLACGDITIVNIEDLIKAYLRLRNETEQLIKEKENSIPKQLIKEKQNELQKEYEEALEENSTKAFILKCKLEMIRELLK